MFNKAFTIACILAISVEARRVREDRGSSSSLTARGGRSDRGGRPDRDGRDRQDRDQQNARDWFDERSDESESEDSESTVSESESDMDDNQEDVIEVPLGSLESHHHNGKILRGNKVDNKTVLEAGLVADEDEDPTSKFMEWGAVQNKSWKSNSEFNEKRANWKHNNDEIVKLNKASKASGDKDAPVYGHNALSDCDDAERSRMKGYSSIKSGRRLNENRQLGSAVTLSGDNRDYSGVAGGVRDQGGCGSCWAYAGNTALEGTLNLYGTTENLSNQFPVSCTTWNTSNRNIMGGDFT